MYAVRCNKYNISDNVISNINTRQKTEMVHNKSALYKNVISAVHFWKCACMILRYVMYT